MPFCRLLPILSTDYPVGVIVDNTKVSKSFWVALKNITHLGVGLSTQHNKIQERFDGVLFQPPSALWVPSLNLTLSLFPKFFQSKFGLSIIRYFPFPSALVPLSQDIALIPFRISLFLFFRNCFFFFHVLLRDSKMGFADFTLSNKF